MSKKKKIEGIELCRSHYCRSHLHIWFEREKEVRLTQKQIQDIKNLVMHNIVFDAVFIECHNPEIHKTFGLGYDAICLK